MKKEVKEKEKKGNKSKKKTKNNINKLDNIKIYIKKVLNKIKTFIINHKSVIFMIIPFVLIDVIFQYMEISTKPIYSNLDISDDRNLYIFKQKER